jgi:hypothetical protein
LKIYGKDNFLDHFYHLSGGSLYLWWNRGFIEIAIIPDATSRVYGLAMKWVSDP